MVNKHLLSLGLTLLGAACGLSAAARPADAGAASALRSIPAWFEPNRGFADGEVKYFSRGAGYTLSMKESGAVLKLADGSAAASMRIGLAGGNARPVLEAGDPLPGRTDYIIGNRPGAWKHSVPHFGQIRYRQAYPGVDLVYYSAGRDLEYDFVVSPGADTKRIRLRFEGAESVRLDESGALVIGLGGREIRQPRPLAYQEAQGRRTEVEARYAIAGNRDVLLALGRYDRSRTLVIDPILAYAGYFGGDQYDVPTGLAVDSGGNVWLTGTTLSIFTPPDGTSPYAATLKGNSDVFVAKLRIEPSGPPTLLYWTYLGGSFEDRGGLIEVDASGKVYLTGSTFSSDFPVSSNALISTAGGDLDGFAVKLDPDAAGTASLLYGTYLGGSGRDVATALSVDASGRMLVAGYTDSPQLTGIPTDAVQASNQGGYEAMLYQLDPAAAAGQTLLFGTFLGGGSTDIATGVASDASGAIYLSGYTMSSNLPIAGDSYKSALNAGSNVFVVKFDPSRSGLDRLVYGTYLGGSGVDIATSMRLDQSGGVWLTGYTTSTDFPVTSGAYQARFGGGIATAFLARLDPALPAAQALTYSTYFGGSGTDVAYGLALVGGGKVALAGYTESDDFPVKGALPAGQARDVGADAFVALLDSTVAGANALVYSTYFGGSSATDVASRIALSPTGSIFVSGYTDSSDLPVTDGSSRGTPSGSTTGFLLRLDPLPGELFAVQVHLRSGDNTALGVVTPRRTLLGIQPQPRRQSR
jgi:Beta-propeller repeat.